MQIYTVTGRVVDFRDKYINYWDIYQADMSSSKEKYIDAVLSVDTKFVGTFQSFT